MALVNLKKIGFFSFDFLLEFLCSNISAVTEHTRNQIFSASYQKVIFFKFLRFGPIRWVPRWFYKISINYSPNFHFILVFLSNFRKLKHAHAEHKRKQFYSTLSLRWTNFHTCSASGKILTVFTCTSILSIPGNNFIAPWSYKEII